MGSEKVRNVLIGVLIAGLIGLTVAYASLSQRLDIKSTATVKASTWAIKFANLSAANTVGTARVTTQPTLTDTLVSGLDVELTKPGDTVSYTFDIVNEGTIDAKISTYKINANGDGIVCTDADASTVSDSATTVCNGLTYTLTYTSDTTADQTGSVITAGTPVAQDQELKAGQTVKVTLTVSFDSEKVPSSDVKVTGLDAYMIYEQN